jgi:16S rRNA (uracil1498-N3)-methyltransferase
MSEGSAVELFDGNGVAASGEVLRIRGESVTVRLLEPLESRESPLSLAIGIAVPKGDRMTWTVQKLTELGVTRLVLLLTDHGEVKSAACEKNLSRWNRVALEACKQSGRSAIPRISDPATLEEILGAHGGIALMARPGAEPLSTSVAPDSNMLALVGPEGGWSERELALAASKNVVSFGLGPRTLRTETAAITVAVLLQSIGGDL